MPEPNVDGVEGAAWLSSGIVVVFPDLPALGWLPPDAYRVDLSAGRVLRLERAHSQRRAWRRLARSARESEGPRIPATDNDASPNVMEATPTRVYHLPAQEHGISVARPGMSVLSQEPLAENDLLRVAELVSRAASKEVCLGDALRAVVAWALPILREASKELQSPWSEFCDPYGSIPATEADAVRLEALGFPDLAAGLRATLARGERPTLGTHAPPTSELTPGWFAWNLLRGVGQVSKHVAAGDAEAAALAAFQVGRAFEEARIKEAHEPDALDGSKMRRVRKANSDKTNEKKRAAVAERIAFVRSLPSTLSHAACVERLKGRFPDLTRTTVYRTMRAAGR